MLYICLLHVSRPHAGACKIHHQFERFDRQFISLLYRIVKVRFSVLAEWAAVSASGWQNGGRASGGGFGGLSLTSRCKDTASVRPGCRYVSFRVVNSGRNYAKCVCNSLITSIIEEQQSHFSYCKKCVSRRGRNAVLEGRGNPFQWGKESLLPAVRASCALAQPAVPGTGVSCRPRCTCSRARASVLAEVTADEPDLTLRRQVPTVEGQSSAASSTSSSGQRRMAVCHLRAAASDSKSGEISATGPFFT